MKSYRQILNESLRDPFPYTLKIEGHKVSAIWNVPGEDGKDIPYGMACLSAHTYIGKSWAVNFSILDVSRSKEYKLSGTGSAFRIFATVMSILKEFITIKQPDRFHFAANKKENSRVKLYQRFAKNMTNMYHVTTLKAGGDVLYFFHKDEELEFTKKRPKNWILKKIS
jgi:hypothetical protein